MRNKMPRALLVLAWISLLPALTTARSAATGAAYTVRLAARSDLLPLSNVVERAFAAPPERQRTFGSAKPPTWFDALYTRARIGLDIERRMTPWDWCRHAQYVAEGRDGEILGFAEVWGEDAEYLYNLTAKTPQPVLFNLCVAASARRLGVARDLMSECEAMCASWGDDSLYLKVRDDNLAACALYENTGYDLLETRPVAELPGWQDRWKGGTTPLRVMRKKLLVPGGSIDSVIAPKSFDEFEVKLATVLGYEDRDAVIWFVLLVLRNLEFLSPQYRALPAFAVFAAFGSYVLLVRILSQNPELYDALRAAVLGG